MIKIFTDIYKNFDLEYSEILAEIYFVLFAKFNLTKKDILLGKTMSDDNILKAKLIFEKRVTTGLPIQYVINKAIFKDDVFYVDENVLIPRDDTQILTDKAIDLIKKNNLKKVIDVATGSGIIAIEIAKHTDVKVYASDISKDALEIAKKNAKMQNVQIQFIQSDLLKNINEKFDMIVSNPPYIPFELKDSLQNEVKKFEPQLALFASDDGLEYYTKITREAQKSLEKQGFLLYEVGINQAESVKNLMRNSFENISVSKDVSGIERVVLGQLKS